MKLLQHRLENMHYVRVAALRVASSRSLPTIALRNPRQSVTSSWKRHKCVSHV